MSSYTPGQVVKIHRPNKDLHGCFARFLGPSPDDLLVWVALEKPLKYATRRPPDEKVYANTNKTTPKLLPLSNLHAV